MKSKAQSITLFFIKNISLDKTYQAKISLPGEVLIERWEKNYIQVMATILSKNAGIEELKEFTLKGRYDFKIVTREDCLNILMPNIKEIVFVEGKEHSEIFYFNILLPEEYLIKYP